MSMRNTLMIAIALLAITPSAILAAGAYTFTKVLESGGDVSGFSPFFSLNDRGEVAALATKTSGGNVILVGDGGAVRTVADNSSGTFTTVDNPSINSAGTVAFFGVGTDRGIYADSGAGVHLLVDYATYYNNAGNSPLNSSGSIAFVATSGFPAVSSVFVADGASVRVAADDSGPLGSLSSNGPDLNDSGIVAFRANLDSGAQGVFKSDGATLTTIADTSGPLASIPGFSPSINNSGSVAFLARTDTGDTGIFVGNGGALTTIADTSGPISFLTAPSINDAGTVAFGLQNLTDYSLTGIYAGSDLVKDAVITAGDMLDGASFSGFDSNRVLINNSGQVAFLGRTFGQPDAIYVATPTAVPEPSSALLALAGAASLGLVLTLRRRAKRIRSSLINPTLLALTALLGCLPVASAGSLTYNGSVSDSVSNIAPYPSTNLDNVRPIAIPKFDPSLGALTTMTIQFTNLQTGSFSIQVDNESHFPIGTSARQNVDFAVSAGLVNSSPVSGSGAWSSSTFLAPDQSSFPPNFYGPDSATLTLSGVSIPSTLVKNVESAALSNYTGTGTVNIGLKVSVTPGFQSTMHNSSTPATNPAYRLPSPYTSVPFSGTYAVEYQYDPVSAVPEPSTLTLSGFSALIGLAYAFRRRRSGRDPQ